MKTLEKQFVFNADKCGDQIFTQVKREGNVCMYRRQKIAGGPIQSFEVFVTKVVKAGAPLPGGGQVAEDYEQYPGKSAFGRTAWSIGGVDGEKRASEKFDLLVKEANKIIDLDAEIEENDPMPVARVSKGEVTLKIPEKPFTQKELAAFNGFDNYKVVYSDLQKMLSNGTLKVAGERESTRGKPAKLFARA